MHPINLLAKMTEKGIRIEGAGFGGQIEISAVDVGCALGYSDPYSGKKLDRRSYNAIRAVYCLDNKCKIQSIGALLLQSEGWIKREGFNIRPDTLFKLCKTVIIDASTPNFVKNGSSIEQEIEPRSNYWICKQVGLHKSSFNDKHEQLYSYLLITFYDWIEKGLRHLSNQFDESLI